MIQDKVIIVTGAGSGIGEGTAMAMAEEGAKLVLADINADSGMQTLSQIKSLGAEAEFIETDVADEADVEKMVSFTMDTYGRLDGAFNNAGIEGQLVPLPEIELKNFQQTITVNLQSIFLCMKYQIPAMEKNGGGSIINNSSVMGTVAGPMLSAYCASKHGVIGITKSAALECAQKGVRINAICPGGIETPMVTEILETNPEALESILAAVPYGRLGSTTELAEIVIWLCSDRSTFASGTYFTIDGCYTAQ